MKMNFNSDEVDPQADFEPLPAGIYTAMITKTDEKTTRNGDGSYLELTLTIASGPHSKRLLWDRLNLNNPNEQAVNIAKATLSSICKAVSVPKLTDSDQLIGRPMNIKVIQKEFNGEMKNEVKGYKSREDTYSEHTNQAAAPPIIPDDDIPF